MLKAMFYNRFLWLIVAGIVVVQGQLTKFVDIAHAIQIAELSAKSNDPESVYYSASLLKSFNISNGFSSCDCATSAKKFAKADEIHSAYYTLKHLKQCECEVSTFPHSLDLEKIIEESADLSSIIWSVGAAYEYQSKLSDAAVGKAIEKLRHLMTPQGLFWDSLSKTSATSSNTIDVLEVLILAAESKEFASFTTELFEKAFALIPSETSDDTASNPLLVTALSKLSEKKLRLLGPRLVLLAESLVELTATNDVHLLAQAVEALRVISSYKSAPLVVELAQTSFDREEADQLLKLVVRVVDVFGEPIRDASVHVASVKNVGKDGLVLSNQQTEGGVLSVPFKELSVGRHIVHLDVSVEGRTKPLSVQTFFVVTESVGLSDVFVGVTSDAPLRSELLPVGEDSKGRHLKAAAADSDFLYVEFALTNLGAADSVRKPHQATVRLANHMSGRSLLFPAKRLEASTPSKIVFGALISLAENSDRFAHSSGTFQISVLVADVTYTAPLSKELGSVDVVFVAPQPVNLPLYAKSLLHASDVTLAALPEIEHVMRLPAKKASDFMATLFTLLTALPLVAFLVFVSSLAPDVRGLSSLSGGFFALCLAFTLGLYVCYWLALDGVSFYQTIKYLFCVFPLTVMIGRYSLSVVSDRRTGAVKSE